MKWISTSNGSKRSTTIFYTPSGKNCSSSEPITVLWNNKILFSMPKTNNYNNKYKLYSRKLCISNEEPPPSPPS